MNRVHGPIPQKVAEHLKAYIIKKEIRPDEIEIVSKLIFRHANLSTTQRYLGRITDVEAMTWIGNLHG